MYTLNEAREQVGSIVESQARAVTSTRARMAEAASSATPSDLAQLVNDLAGFYGAVSMAETVYWALEVEEGCDVEAHLANVVKYAITQPLLRGADDSWSGRRNDAARAQHDGVRKVADELMRILERVTV